MDFPWRLGNDHSNTSNRGVWVSRYGKRGEECAACGKERSYRIHRRWWERIRTLIDGKVPFRCNECGHKEYHWIDPRDRERASRPRTANS